MSKRRFSKLSIIIVLCLILTSCANSVSLHTKDSEFSQYYADLGEISGFKNFDSINLYETYWMLKISNYLDLNIKNKGEIFELLKDIDVLDKEQRNLYGLGGMPEIIAVLNYTQLAKEINYKIDEEYKQKLVNYILSLSTSDGSFKTSTEQEEVTFWCIQALLLLEPDISIPDKTLTLLNRESNTLSSKYLLVKLKGGLKKNDIKKLISQEYNIESFNPQTLSQVYLYKSILDEIHHKSKPKISIKPNLVDSILNEYLSLSHPVDPQLLYKLLYISNYHLPKSQKIIVENLFNNAFLNKGWGVLSYTINLPTTYVGLVIFNKEKIHYNKDGVNNYLTRSLNDLIQKDLNLSTLLNLRILTYSFLELDNQAMLTSIDKYLNNQMKTIDVAELNPLFINTVIEIGLLMNKDYSTIRHYFKKADFLKIKEIIGEVEKGDMNNIEELYILYQIKALDHNLSKSEKNTMIQLFKKFQKQDGSFSNLIEDKSSVPGTLVAINAITNLKLPIKRGPIFKYIKSQLKQNKNSDNLMLVGQLYKAIEVLNKE